MVRMCVSAFARSGRLRFAGVVALALGVAALTLAVEASASPAAKTTARAATSLPPLSQVLSAGYKGNFQPPPSTGPKAVRGKTVWFISCGQAYAACADMSTAFAQAGAVLGWHVKIMDGAASPTTAASIIRQAVAAKVDGIATVSYDCPDIKSALLEARAAKIPVVNTDALDCNDPMFGGKGQSLFTTINVMNSTSSGIYNYNWNKARADFLAATLHCKGPVLQVYDTDEAIHTYMANGFRTEFKARCPKTQIVPVPFTFSQVPTQFTQIVESALLKHPNAAALSEDTDALMGLGLETALRRDAPKGLYVAGGEGLQSNLPLIRSGIQSNATYIPDPWFMWAMADSLNRIFSGESAAKLPNEGGGWEYIDKSHNLPAAGKSFQPSVNYQALYTKVWTGK